MSPPHHNQWLFHSEGNLPPYRVAEVLRKLADEIFETRGGRLGDEDVTLPEELYAIVRYERLPKGELVIKVEAKWNDFGGGRGELPISQFLGPGGSLKRGDENGD
jgi:hypothetical protein